MDFRTQRAIGVRWDAVVATFSRIERECAGGRLHGFALEVFSFLPNDDEWVLPARISLRGYCL